MKIAITSDAHGNLAALEAVLADIRARDAKEVFHLGDAVGYGPCPQECLALLQRERVSCLLGNHEDVLLRPGAAKGFNPHVAPSLKLTDELVDQEGRRQAAAWPSSLRSGQAWLVHGFPPDSFTKYLFDVEDDRIKEAMAALPVDICFVGHTHDLEMVSVGPDGQVEREPLLPGALALSPRRKILLNVGSVGRPGDGDWRAKYVLWEPETGKAEIRAVPYDRAATKELLKARGFPDSYAKRLG